MSKISSQLYVSWKTRIAMKAKKKKWWYAKKEYRVDKDDAFAIQLSWGTCEKVTGTGDTKSQRRWEAKTDIRLYYLLSEESSQLAKEYVE